ncbi:MAG: hypothetical protein WKF90_15840 [Pyrinomonadaceae bacterium]
MFEIFLIITGLGFLFASLTSLIEDTGHRQGVKMQGASVAGLFFFWKLYEISSGSDIAICSIVPMLVFFVLFLSNLSFRDKEFGWAWKGIATFIPIGILSLVLAIVCSISTAFEKEFSAKWNFLQGAVFLGAGLFLLFPPQMGANWSSVLGKRKNTGDFSNMSIFDDSLKNTDDDLIDKMLSDIMNAGTNLDDLLRTNPNLANNVQSTLNSYNPNTGIFGSWAKRVRGEGRTKLLKVLTEEQRLLIEQAALFEQKVREGARSQVEFKVFLAENAMKFIELRTKAKLNSKAFDKEMLPEDWSRVRTEQEFLDIRLKEEQARADREEIREQERQKRKLQEEEEKHLRDQKAEEERINRNLESAKKFKMSEEEITDDLRQKLVKAYTELDEIESKEGISDRTRTGLIESKQNQINNLRFRIAAREKKAQSDEESYL